MRSLGMILLACVGCSSDPADVEGDYTIAVTNRDNGCQFANWTVGEQSASIPVTVTQSDTTVTAQIKGVTGTFVAFALGSATYTGEIDGDHLALDLFGTRSQMSGNCAFTYNSSIIGDVDGDTLTGRVEYTAATNNNPDCAAIEGCLSYQEFNGTRPPT